MQEKESGRHFARLASQGRQSQTIRIDEMKHQQNCVSYILSNHERYYKIMREQ
jgi:hypothetical protein